MYSKSKLFFIASLWLVIIPSTIAQQFTLEATVDYQIRAILDIDGDGICEYIAHNNGVYDGATHILKFQLPSASDIHWEAPIQAQNPYSFFPHIDYNSDGIRDLIIYVFSPTLALVIYDVSTNSNLFEFQMPSQQNYLVFQDLIDIDGDGELEIIIFTSGASYKTYIYSTGVQITSIQNDERQQPNYFGLKQNFPNPFNPNTTIRYSISSPEQVSIKIYDISGQLIKEINKEHYQAGEFEVVWDGKNNFGEKVSSGSYFYQLVIGNHSEAKKMILLK